jgi:hypothetical protein
MATLRYNGFQLRIYSNDHPPPHVHVIQGNGELRIMLGDDDNDAYIEKILSPMKRTDARNALQAVRVNKKLLLEKWRAIYER